MAYLLAYLREPIDSFRYDARLACSLHLAVSQDGVNYMALNHNSGILFVKATEKENGALIPRTLRYPVLWEEKGSYQVLALCTGPDGEEPEEPSYLWFTTEDFMEYTMQGVYSEEAAEKEGLPADRVCALRQGHCSVPEGITVTDQGTPAEGVIPMDVLEIPEALYALLVRKLTVLAHTGTEFPAAVRVHSQQELEAMKATAVYSDGSTALKSVDWDFSGVDFSKPGVYTINGTLHREHFPFPTALHRADPCVGKWNGKYYFIATNDADDNHTLYIREADTISGLVDAPEHLLLDSNTYPGIGGLLWAPEFHEVDGKWYIFHAATPGEFFWEESHVMALREGGNPINPKDWSAPKRVVRKDGSDICEAGKEITLDMTCFFWEGAYYAVWSQRQFLPEDLGAWLYIAKLNAKEPWKLDSDPVVLSKPEYGWANNHTFVDEGPFALIRGETLYLTFSSAAVDTSYVVGMFTIQKGMDPLDPRSWKKKGYPILTSRSVKGEFGTGHNAYVEDADGTIWNTYHARPGIEGVRSSGIRRVHFDADGEPRLDLTEELDVNGAYAAVKTEVTVQ